MNQQTLKEQLKPPFVSSFPKKGEMLIDYVLCADGRVILENHFFDHEVTDFITAALNEKWERDYSEPSDNVDCFICRHFFVDEKDLARCKLKGNSVTIDPEIKEPCNGFENKKIEPLRWIRVWRDPENLSEGSYLKCPKCSGVTWDEDDINYCPHCGQKLKPPDGEKQ